MNFTKLVFIFLFIVTVCIFSQNSNYIYRNLRMEDGLSQSTILSLAQDKEGYIWIGTADGLDRYDGYKLKIYNAKNSLTDNTINSLFVDKNGFLWVGVLSGELNLYNKVTDSFSNYDLKKIINSNLIEDKPSENDYPMTQYARSSNTSITSITEDDKGRLWVGTWGIGLFCFGKDGKKIKLIKHYIGHNNSLKRITKVITYGNYTFVSTLGNGLFIINKTTNQIKQLTISSINSNLLSNELLTLFITIDNKLILSNYKIGIQTYKIDNKFFNDIFDKNKFPLFDNINAPFHNVMSIVCDRHNNLWFGTFGNGLYKSHSSKLTDFINFRHEQFNQSSLIDNEIISLLVDRTNILWIGTHLGKGASRLIKGNIKFNSLQKESNTNLKLNDDVVWSIYQNNENLYIGTYRGGLNIINFKTNSSKYLTKDNSSLSDNHIRKVTMDSYGNLWIGTFSGGLNVYNKKTNKFSIYKNIVNDSTSISSNQIIDILFDGDSVAWIATYGGGLNKCKISGNPAQSTLKFKRFIHNESKNSISDNRVYVLRKFDDDYLYIGTYGGGLNILDIKTKKFKVLKNSPYNNSSISDNRVLSICKNSIGDIWVGTFGGNLNKYNIRTDSFQRLSSNVGLNTQVIYGILEDDLGNFWLSTDNGIIKYNYSTNKTTYFDVSDGIQSLEFSGGSYFKNKEGIMYFGGVVGLNYFNPDSIKENLNIPPIVITSFKVFDEEYNLSNNTITLDYDQNYISFEFSALDYTNPAKNLYLYTLDNLNNSWMLSDSKNRIATYTNLSPGEYTFRVIGSNNDGLWNEKGISINIVILSPFWEKWWFILLVSIVLLLIIFSIIYFRFQSILAVERLKSKLAADLHDNIGSGLTEISIMSELVVAQIPNISENLNKELNKISDTARFLIDTMSDIVWVVNPHKDTIHDLIVRLRDSYGDIYSYKGIAFTTLNVDKLINIKLNMEFKQHLYLIFKEALNNSLKHSKCTKINLEVNFKNNYLKIIMKDNGIGVDVSNVKFGNGIKNMKNRAALLNCKLDIESKLNEGTTITFFGKIQNSSLIKSIISGK